MSNEKGFLRESLSWLGSLIIALAVALFIISNVVSMTMVMEQSMEPTFSQGDRLLVNRLGYAFSSPSGGDIVILDKNPIKSGLLRNMINEINDIRNNIRFRLTGVAEKNLLVKRVVAVGGDNIRISNGEIHINGTLLQEPYINTQTYTRGSDNKEWDVPQGMVFVLGDNRGNSLDSRELGYISEDQIKGKVSFRIFPLNKFGKVQ